MAKISENMIPDINADWGLDARNNLPYSGEAVQEFIKRTLKQKHGYFHYDEDQNKYLVFADQASMEGYYDGDDSLLLSIFDAPASYTIECDLESGAYNSVLFGSTGNLLRFKAVTKKSNADVPEGYICNIKFTNGGVQKTLPLQFNAEESLNGITINIDKYFFNIANSFLMDHSLGQRI